MDDVTFQRRLRASTYGGSSGWKLTLREAVKLPSNMDERILALWRSQPAGTDPLGFALAVSDDNFVPTIDPA